MQFLSIAVEEKACNLCMVNSHKLHLQAGTFYINFLTRPEMETDLPLQVNDGVHNVRRAFLLTRVSFAQA